MDVGWPGIQDANQSSLVISSQSRSIYPYACRLTVYKYSLYVASEADLVLWNSCGLLVKSTAWNRYQMTEIKGVDLNLLKCVWCELGCLSCAIMQAYQTTRLRIDNRVAQFCHQARNNFRCHRHASRFLLGDKSPGWLLRPNGSFRKDHDVNNPIICMRN